MTLPPHLHRVLPVAGPTLSQTAHHHDTTTLLPTWKSLLLEGAHHLGPRWAAFLKDTLDVPRSTVATASLENARAVWHRPPRPEHPQRLGSPPCGRKAP